MSNLSCYADRVKTPKSVNNRRSRIPLKYCIEKCKLTALTSMNKTLGERIRELRSEGDLSLREFAEKLGGLSAAFLSDIELGRRHPSEKILAEMARILKTPLEELRQYDTRAPVEELKRMVSSNPAYGLALRQIVEKRVSPEALMKLAEKESGSGKKPTS